MTGTVSDSADTQPILDAASILLVDTAGPVARVLMGLRQATNVFLPNKWVFPGGRLEPSDKDAPIAGDLEPEDTLALRLRLLPSTPPRLLAKALAVAAVRELFEETGHAIALPTAPAHTLDVSGRTLKARDRFAQLGFVANLSPLRLLARAITPPGRTRRYDTRFFVAHRPAVLRVEEPQDDEFAALNWFTLEQAQSLDLPNITRRMLQDLETVLLSPAHPDHVPFYYEQDGSYRRDHIERPISPRKA